MGEDGKLRVLIVEDDDSMRSLLADILDGEGYHITAVADGQEALHHLEHRGPYEIVLSDLRLPSADGMQVLKRSRELLPDTPVLLLTAFGTISNAVEAMKVGAFDYLTKPLQSPEMLRVTVARAAAHWRKKGVPALSPEGSAARLLVHGDDGVAGAGRALATDGAPARGGGDGGGGAQGVPAAGQGGAGPGGGQADSVNRGESPEGQTPRIVVAGRGGGDALVWNDPVSLKILELLNVVAMRDTTVLLLGESGVGKDVAAQLIHRASGRSGNRFVAVNCAAVPDNLFESEFFGHEKGAFTGATTFKKGHLEEAHMGTIFLDEVGELSLSHQAKLLRAIEERKVVRVGGNLARPADARVIAATNKDLLMEVQQGRFRQDLYYRLSVFPLVMPPLRERPADILPLARLFLEQALKAGGGPGGEMEGSLSDGGARALLSYSWPGNVRELRNVMERAVVLAGPDGVIGESHLFAGNTGGAGMWHPLESGSGLAVSGTDGAAGGVLPPGDWPYGAGDGAGADRVGAGPVGAGAYGGEGSVTLKELERSAIIQAVDGCDGNRRAAAKKLGISVRTLQYKLKEYGMVRDG